jgi:uncharacterized damage-inducible protein DinB
MSHGQDAARTLESTAAEIAADVRGLPGDMLYWHPSPEEWSVMDNLCHIEEFIPFWMGEIETIVVDPTQLWGRNQAHEGRLAAVRDTSRRELGEVLRAVSERTGKAAASLRALGDVALQTEATSRNPRWGVKPAQFIVDELLVGHLKNHRGQVQRTIAKYRQAHAS